MFWWLAENPVGNLNFIGKYAVREDMLGLLLIHQAFSEHKSCQFAARVSKGILRQV